MPKVNYEERFYLALKRITAYMTPKQLERTAEKSYGLDYVESLEMAYENIRFEAQDALRGYRRPSRNAQVGAMEPAKATSASEAP